MAGDESADHDFPEDAGRPGLAGQVAVVTGGGGAIGADIARELAAAGMRVAVTGRTRESVERVAAEIGGIALVGDVSKSSDVEAWFSEIRSTLGSVDLLVNNAAVIGAPEPFWELDPAVWWRVYEVNVLGVFLCCRAVAQSMVERRRGRIVNVTSGAAYIRDIPPNAQDTSYPPSKAAVTRFTERLAAQLEPFGVFAFAMAPGIVRSRLTADLPETTPWTPPDAPAKLVRKIAAGTADALTGRYLHAEHDADLEALAQRADEVILHDLNALRLRRDP
jgi:NAD(P)-dependent dehydrogenase (short-subunit alcohol dehydrogenase family)